MIKVNLLRTAAGTPVPREWVPREQRSAVIGLGLLMLTAVSVGGWWYELRHTRATLDTKISQSETELAHLKDAAKVVTELSDRKTELNERLALIQQLRTTKRAPVNLLETVSRSLPDGLWLLDLKQTGPSTQIDGRATSLTAVTDFTERLQDSGLFQRPVEILTTTTETIDDATVVRFSLKADAATSPAPDSAPVAAVSPTPAVVPPPPPPSPPQTAPSPAAAPSPAPVPAPPTPSVVVPPASPVVAPPPAVGPAAVAPGKTGA